MVKKINEESLALGHALGYEVGFKDGQKKGHDEVHQSIASITSFIVEVVNPITGEVHEVRFGNGVKPVVV